MEVEAAKLIGAGLAVIGMIGSDRYRRRFLLVHHRGRP